MTKVLAVLALAYLTRGGAVRSHVNATEINLDTSSGNICEEAVPGANVRACAGTGLGARLGYMVMGSSFCTPQCECPIHTELKGAVEGSLSTLAEIVTRCPGRLVDGTVGGSVFDPEEVKGKGCACVAPPPSATTWVETAAKKPTADCPQESYFGTLDASLPDFLATAPSWCNSSLVPKEKRMPEALQGLYWMKGNDGLEDVAFCTSIAEWDDETKTALLSPWTDFVWRVGADKKSSSAWRATWPLVYHMNFTGDDYKKANISAEAGITGIVGYLFSKAAEFPLVAVDKTPDVTPDGTPVPDGTVITKEKDHDVFQRPSLFFKSEKFEDMSQDEKDKLEGTYYAIRIMDQGGNRITDQGWWATEQAQWYEQMKEAEDRPGEKTSFIRYTQGCRDNLVAEK